MKRGTPILLVLLWCWMAGAAHAAPLEPSVRKAFAAIPADPAPPQLAKGAHFVISDEGAHDLFRSAVLNKGGVLVGVGTDPNYLLAGWMRAELMVLVDFDQVVVDLHGLYVLALLDGVTATDFVGFWAADRQKATEARIATAAPDAATKERWLRAYRLGRSQIASKWRHVAARQRAQGVTSLLSDPADYQHVRQLALEGRIFAVRADLTANRALPALHAVLRATQRTVSVLYLTNAETYFAYTPDARRNLRDMPYAPDAVVLRTQGRPSLRRQVADGRYLYFVQAASEFVRWLHVSWLGSYRPMCRARKALGPKGLYRTAPPPVPRKP